MNVFISWSGANSTSHKVGAALSDWLPLVFDNIKCFFSPADAGPGTIWTQDLFKRLEESQFGIICVTARLMGQASPWMFFETGALAKTRVIPLLIDIPPTQLLPPLSAFQGISADKDGIEVLVETLATAGGANPDILLVRFKALWPRLEAEIESAKAADANFTEGISRRPTEDVLVEVLEQMKVLTASIELLTASIKSAAPAPSLLLSPEDAPRKKNF